MSGRDTKLLALKTETGPQAKAGRPLEPGMQGNASRAVSQKKCSPVKLMLNI